MLRCVFVFLVCNLFTANSQRRPCHEKLALRSIYATEFTQTCTKMGYFELVQCDPSVDECFCVDPLTGEEIKNTRITQGKLIKCPVCHVHMSRMLRNGVQFGEHIPTCTKAGSYTSKQCRVFERVCYCVEPETGTEVPQTRGLPGFAAPAVDCDRLVSQQRPKTKEPENKSGTKKLTGKKRKRVQGPCEKELHKVQTAKLIEREPFLPNCMRNGFYELIQCHKSACFCVDPSTGVEAKGTRATYGKILACNACHIQKAEEMRKGPLVGAFVPQCDSEGFFRPKQCHTSTGACWCVDRIGRETSSPEDQGEDVKCAGESGPKQFLKPEDDVYQRELEPKTTPVLKPTVHQPCTEEVRSSVWHPETDRKCLEDQTECLCSVEAKPQHPITCVAEYVHYCTRNKFGSPYNPAVPNDGRRVEFLEPAGYPYTGRVYPLMRKRQ